MIILGIESSCDETAAAVVKDGRLVLSNVINSQIEIHAQYSGVIPEVAARSHLEVINPVINHALLQAKLTWKQIDAIAVTYAPGLIGSLLIGNLAARTLAVVKDKPLINVHHILAHFYANFLSEAKPEFPCLALIVSGGHTQLVLFNSHTEFNLIGNTGDDAVGEAFDKVAKIIGLPYPGGPAISQAAKSGNPDRFKLPHPKTNKPYDFSFSGLKTAVLRTAQDLVGKDFRLPSYQVAPLLNLQDKYDLAASFQKTAIDVLVSKTVQAYQDFDVKSVVMAGGVAANQLLRQELTANLPITLNFPDQIYCTDNAAMVAAAGYYMHQYTGDANPLESDVIANLRIDKLSN